MHMDIVASYVSNCGIIVVVVNYGHNIEYNGLLFEQCSKVQ